MARVLVLGGYGLIGAACLRRLVDAGHEVTGMGRSRRAARQVAPDLPWVIRDIARVTEAEWRTLLRDVDAMVNASGALQDGARDDLAAIHDHTLARLAAALTGSATRLVQISAAGVAPDAPTAFFRTKARGEAHLQSAGIDHVILRPVLVLAPEAYGGTALLRAAAAIPLVQADILGDAPVQTVSVEDVADAVVRAVEGQVPSGTVADLTEPGLHSLRDTTRALRAWLGLPPWRATLPLPEVLLAPITLMSDGLGHLGWRGPLRTNAVAALRAGIRGDPSAWQATGGPACTGLDETLRRMPATAQDRTAAMAYLLIPLLVGGLALFWMVSGLVGLARLPAAAEVLTSRGATQGVARAAVVAGALADIALGAAVLVRPWARGACLGMVALSLGYLLAGTVAAPDLWADPLGAFVKVIPAILAALATAALLGPR